MRKRKAPANTYWRGETLWGRVKIKGELVRWSLRTGDVDVARARVEAERERLIAAAHYGDDRPTYDDVFSEWGSRHIIHEVGPLTARRYAVSLKQLKPMLTGLYLDEITTAKVGDIVNQRRTADVTTATIRRDLAALSSVLKFAIDEGLRKEGDNPALFRLQRLKERRDPIVLPDHELIKRVIAAASPAMAPLIATALATGCRQNELVAAERSALDHARRQLTVRGKGNKVRVVDLDFGDGYEVLRKLPVMLGCRWLFWHEAGGSRRGKRRPDRPRQGAEPFRGASGHFHRLVRRVIREAQKEAQAAGAPVPDWQPFRFHDLRHRHAVDWLKSGRSIYDLQKRLGHESVKTTEIYLKHLTPEEARAAMFSGAQKEAQGQRFGG